MIARILNAAAGDASECIRYIEGEHDHKGNPRDRCVTLYGESRMLLAVTKHCMTRKWRYLSTTLSFTKEESQRLSDEDIHALSLSFAQHLTVGAFMFDIPTVIQLHEHDGAVDVHIVLARYDTSTGKSFEPFVIKSGDGKRLQLWQDLQVMKYDELDDPREASRIRRVAPPPRKIPKNKGKKIENIQESLLSGIKSGCIQNRDDVIKKIQELGFTIKAKYSLSIVVQLLDESCITLKGAIYHESFKSLESLEKINSAVPRRGHPDFETQYQQTSEELASRDAHRKDSYETALINHTLYNHTAYGNNYCSFINFIQNNKNAPCKNDTVSIKTKDKSHTDIAILKDSGCEEGIAGCVSLSEDVREKPDDVCSPKELVNIEAQNEEIVHDPEIKKGDEANNDEAELDFEERVAFCGNRL